MDELLREANTRADDANQRFSKDQFNDPKSFKETNLERRLLMRIGKQLTVEKEKLDFNCDARPIVHTSTEGSDCY